MGTGRYLARVEHASDDPHCYLRFPPWWAVFWVMQVTNTGVRSGRHVLLAFLTPPAPQSDAQALQQPLSSLAAFASLPPIKPGHTRTALLRLSQADFQLADETGNFRVGSRWRDAGHWLLLPASRDVCLCCGSVWCLWWLAWLAGGARAVGAAGGASQAHHQCAVRKRPQPRKQAYSNRQTDRVCTQRTQRCTWRSSNWLVSLG